MQMRPIAKRRVSRSPPIRATTMSTVFRLSAYADMAYLFLSPRGQAEMPNPVIEQHAGVMPRSPASFSAVSSRMATEVAVETERRLVALGQVLTVPALSPPDAALKAVVRSGFRRKAEVGAFFQKIFFSSNSTARLP